MERRPDRFRDLKILHLVLTGGMTIFLILVLIVSKMKPIAKADEDYERVLQVVTVVLSLGSLVVGYNIFKRKIISIRGMKELAEMKMQLYKGSCVTWWAFIEGPGLLAIIGFYLTGNYSFFALALFHISLLAVFMPRKENIILLLNLTVDEVAMLEGKS